MIAKMMMMVVVEVTWFPTCDIPSARKWLFKVEMADALEVQSFLIQRLVGLLLAESPVITGSQPGVRGCGPLSLLLIYSSFMIRDQSQQSENRGVGEIERIHGIWSFVATSYSDGTYKREHKKRRFVMRCKKRLSASVLQSFKDIWRHT